MSNEFYENVAKALAERNVNLNCPNCKVQKEFTTQIYRMYYDKKESLDGYEPMTQNPFISLQCKLCGHTDLYNLQRLGIF